MQEQDKPTLADVAEILWPNGEPDHEWSADTLDAIAQLCIAAGLGPTE